MEQDIVVYIVDNLCREVQVDLDLVVRKVASLDLAKLQQKLSKTTLESDSSKINNFS